MATRSKRYARLPRAFPSRYGAPIIDRVDLDIFRRSYFTQCLLCSYCHDACCDHGVDVDLWHVERIRAYADQLEGHTGLSRTRWFTDEIEHDAEMPGGGSLRTRVESGHCVFLNRRGRGCLLHAFCVQQEIDYHELKSMVDCLFPITFCERTLCPSDGVDDDSLICLDTGPTLYRGLRDEVQYYFGSEFVAVLDEVEGSLGRSRGLGSRQKV